MALVSGLAALGIFVRLLRNQQFHRFALYVWPVGAACSEREPAAGGRAVSRRRNGVRAPARRASGSLSSRGS